MIHGEKRRHRTEAGRSRSQGKEVSESTLLMVKLDGELVAEARLRVIDPAGAWLAFRKAFEWLAPMVVYNELTNTVRRACEGDTEEQGIIVDLTRRELGVEETEGSLIA